MRGGDFKRSRDISGSGNAVFKSVSRRSNHVVSLVEKRLYRASFLDLQPRSLDLRPQYLDAAVMMCQRSLEYFPSKRLLGVRILSRY